MGKQARYAIHVPTHDNTGQPLRDLAQAAHEHLFRAGAIEGSYIERGKVGNWRDYAPEGMDHLVTYAEDTPETDSHIKQTAQYVGELANQEAMAIEKHGKDGPVLWVVDNSNHRPNEPAHPSALQYVPTAQRGGEVPVDAPVSAPTARRTSALDYLTSGATLAN